ncbi:MAG TPA: methyltransferase domain-containing protein [Streptosporangiaceae bacterium]|jgi:SAM-dependent methyltransferase
MTGHTHDDFDWADRLADLRRVDAITRTTMREVAERLLAVTPRGATVVDIGSGAGGMSAQLALALRARGGGTLILVDAVPELLDAATAHVAATLAEPQDASPGEVEVRGVLADAADAELPKRVPPAHLVWAAHVVHHLRDQQEGVSRLARLLAPGGWLALSEGGLGTQCLPWDLGVGEPGLVDRVVAARNRWFADMRADIPGATRLTVGWTHALDNAGLTDTTSFSYLVDHPAPAADEVRQAAAGWLHWHADAGDDRLDPGDRDAIRRLLDPHDSAYVGARDDVFYLSSYTVNLGRRPA